MTTKEKYTLGDSDPWVDIDGDTFLAMYESGHEVEYAGGWGGGRVGSWVRPLLTPNNYGPTRLYAPFRTRQSSLSAFKDNAAQRSERKSRPDLLPSEAVLAAGRVLAFGLEKHPDELWKTLSVEDHVAACTRHLFTHLGGEKQDNESSESHLAHALCRLAFAIARSAE
jgi:hypothetical protein